jgi:hypothetical protein
MRKFNENWKKVSQGKLGAGYSEVMAYGFVISIIK